MNKVLLSVLAVLTVASLTAPVLADSPHFLKHDTFSSLSGASLVCFFKEAGLDSRGFDATATITCSATATALYVCVNGGGNHPQAANKETVNAEVSESGDFPIRNGQTTGSLTVAPPGPGGFSCPPGQTLALKSVSYTNVMVSGAGASLSLDDQSFSDPNVPT